ncbi:MAG: PQQ-like beta-propeller repeat protein [Bryobacterales bacterium]|nr:PQQ-like beta-propeller repeat protein [Bryobacterales bacterium]
MSDAASVPLRLWPGFLLVALQWIIRYAVPLAFPEAILFAVLGGVACGVGVVVWWAFLSRAPKLERWGGLLLMIAVAVLTRPFLDPSIAGGMMGLLFPIYLIPILSLALVLWAAATRGLMPTARRVALLSTVLLACGGFTVLRTEGMTGQSRSEFVWRWSPTKEQLLARIVLPPPPPAATPAVETPAVAPAPAPVVTPPPAEWPGFRGPNRDSIVPGTAIATDWSNRKPAELWRKPIGPGWSSFAVAGDRLYTQEQRGEEEIVSCYDANTGEPIWIHRDQARFWESNAGAGPRGTPTLHEGRVYAFGATGILNALDAKTGARIWFRNVANDTETKIPGWGFSSSPLVVEDTVIVAAGGQLAAYDRMNGKPRWQGPKSGSGYSSPHLYTAGGSTQVVLQSSQAIHAVDPRDGRLLWRHEWPPNGPIVQPAVLDKDLLITGGDGTGMQRLALSQTANDWKIEQRWTTMGLKPNFNDYVAHNNHVYGFDNSILACIDANDGQRKWKGGRYGQGQLLLLRDQNLLLVLSEEGEIALVKAEPDAFSEVARMPVLDGKTWNHPVLVGDRLYIRNGSEMAALRLGAKP